MIKATKGYALLRNPIPIGILLQEVEDDRPNL